MIQQQHDSVEGENQSYLRHLDGLARLHVDKRMVMFKASSTAIYCSAYSRHRAKLDNPGGVKV
jgi:hypothetical protein